MARLILKKSSVLEDGAPKQPAPGDLEYGELALNYAVGTLYYKKSDNTIGAIGAGASPGNGTLSLEAQTGLTNTSVSIGTGTGFSANTATNTTYQVNVGPALSALAGTMTGAGTGFIKKTGQDTYEVDTNTYVTTSSLANYLPLIGGTVTGAVSITNNTASSSTTTGALIVTGGVGVGGNLSIAKAIQMSSTLDNGLYHLSTLMSFSSPSSDIFKIINGRGTAYPAKLLFQSGYNQNTYGAVIGGAGEIRLETNRGNAFVSTATNTVIADQAGTNRIVITGANTQIYNNLTLENSGSLTAGAISATNVTISSSQVLHAGNYSSYTLPLTGGTMTGAISMSGTQTLILAGFAGIEYYNTAGTWEVYIGTENNAGNVRYNSRQGTHTWYANGTPIGSLASTGLSVGGQTITHGVSGDLEGNFYVSGEAYYLAVPNPAGGQNAGQNLWIGRKANTGSRNILLGISGYTNAYPASEFTVFSDITKILGSDNASSTTTGALRVTGGVGIGGNLHVGGTITHAGLAPSTGTGIDQVYTHQQNITLTTSWQDTGVNAAELASGSYVVQVTSVSDFTVGGTQYQEYYTGVMSWFAENTNSEVTDEIVLHRAGHAPNSGTIFLRVQRTPGENTDDLKLQVAGTTTNTAAYQYTFKFRRLI